MSGPAMIEVRARTRRPPDRDDVRWFTVEIRVGGVPVLTGEYTDTPGDGSGRPPAVSLAAAEAQTRETFGSTLAVVFTRAQAPFR